MYVGGFDEGCKIRELCMRVETGSRGKQKYDKTKKDNEVQED
jgi:hypothetical protein